MPKRTVSADGGATPASGHKTRFDALRLIIGDAPALATASVARSELRKRSLISLPNSTQEQELELERRLTRSFRERGNQEMTAIFQEAVVDREAYLRSIRPWTRADDEAKARGAWGLLPGAEVVHYGVREPRVAAV
jgi:hypothetical protein